MLAAKTWRETQSKEVTRGHNIVADGWAGAANPHPQLSATKNVRQYVLEQRMSKLQNFDYLCGNLHKCILDIN